MDLRVEDEARSAAREEVRAWLASQEQKELLRFITCGSVDDGKSTLIGRLLYETKQIFDDQLAALEADSKRHGTQGEKIDFALLVDGLAAEREQGITIDVAYRYFASEKRKFIVADTPGHEQYTRNMVTGASTADVAVLLVDARKGVLTQTRRHSYLAKLVGIRRFVLAVTKMDLVDYDQAAFDAIAAEYRRVRGEYRVETVAPDPGFGAERRQCRRAEAMPRRGMMGQACSSISIRSSSTRLPTRKRRSECRCNGSTGPTSDFRGFAGQIASGSIGPGAEVRDSSVRPASRASRASSRWMAISTKRSPGQSVTLTFADEVDCSRGDVIAAAARSARSRRPVRSDDRVDGRRRAAARPRLLDEDRHADCHRDGPAPEI